MTTEAEAGPNEHRGSWSVSGFWDYLPIGAIVPGLRGGDGDWIKISDDKYACNGEVKEAKDTLSRVWELNYYESFWMVDLHRKSGIATFNEPDDDWRDAIYPAACRYLESCGLNPKDVRVSGWTRTGYTNKQGMTSRWPSGLDYDFLISLTLPGHSWGNHSNTDGKW